MVSARQAKYNARKRELNNQLNELPIFAPQNKYRIYHINRSTSPMILHNLIQVARATTTITIDTETDYYTHEPALIQIELIGTPSIVLLFETCHLPGPSSVLFWLMKSLLKIIFNSSNSLYSWGDAKQELKDFIQYGLFSLETILRINNIDVQKRFKIWHHNHVQFDFSPSSLHQMPIIDKYSQKSIKDVNHKWSLQMAVAYVFDEFLDKRHTKSHWARLLDVNSIEKQSVVNAQEKKTIHKMIQYAVNDCLSVTNLVHVLYLH